MWKTFVSVWSRIKVAPANFTSNRRWKNLFNSMQPKQAYCPGQSFASFRRLNLSWILRHYQRLHNGFGSSKLVTFLLRNFYSYRPPTYILAGGLCSFSWNDNSIKDEEIWYHINELKMLEELEKMSVYEGDKSIMVHNVPEHWETVVNEPNIKVWKLPFKNTGCMQYKVFGRFHDVTARQFFDVQRDLEYRRKWDKLALDINVVDENKNTDEQILRWISYFPYPWSSREYIFIRRSKIYQKENVLALFARSVDHPKCALNKKYVRVPLYVSDMIIKPHSNLDEPGLNYLLTYCDDPQTSIPASLSAWVVSAGLPDYVENLHQAALNIHKHAVTEGFDPKTNAGISDFPNFSSREVETI